MKTLKSYLSVASAVLAASMFATGAHANIVSYTDQAAWNNATANPTSINFESLPGNGYTNLGTSSLTISNVTFNSSSLFSNNQIWGSKYLMGYPSLSTNLPAGAVSVGSNVMMYYGNASVLSIVANTYQGETATITENPGTGIGFFGFTASPNDYITSLVITQSSSKNYTAVDNFSFSTTAVPEPTTIALLGLGLLSVFAARRRKQ